MYILTEKDIKGIVKDIPLNKGIPLEIARSVRENIQKNLYQQLKGCSIYKKLIPKLKKEILRKFYKSKVAYGESVGIITAQSIGERQTQMTLNTFHSAGNSVAMVVTGVPRFKELMDTTKNQKAPCMYLPLKKMYKCIEDIRADIKDSLVMLTLNDLIMNYEMYHQEKKKCFTLSIKPDLSINKINTPRVKWIDFYKDIYPLSFKSYHYFLILKLDKQKIFQYFISLENICEKINSRYVDINAIPSPYAECEIAIFIHWDEFKKEERDVLYINANNRYVFYMEDIIIENIKNIEVGGIKNIQSMYIQSMKEEGKWSVETFGSNFVEMLKHPLFDSTKVLCNNMWEIYNVLGIEATRQFLIDEFNNVVSSDGTYINIRHILIMIDMMTYSGKITSISRYGMNRNEVGPLAKATFEECMENFIKAGIYGEKETTNGVSASIMCGKLAQSGTGMVNLLFKQS